MEYILKSMKRIELLNLIYTNGEISSETIYAMEQLKYFDFADITNNYGKQDAFFIVSFYKNELPQNIIGIICISNYTMYINQNSIDYSCIDYICVNENFKNNGIAKEMLKLLNNVKLSNKFITSSEFSKEGKEKQLPEMIKNILTKKDFYLNNNLLFEKLIFSLQL